MSHDLVRFAQAQSNATADNTGHATLTPSWPKSVGTALTLDTSVAYAASASGQAIKEYTTRTSTLTTTATPIDASMTATLTSRSVAVPANHDTPMVSWTATGGFPTAQGALVAASWTVSGVGTFLWLGIARADVTSVQFPRLPDSLAIDRVAVSQTYTGTQIEIVQSSLFADAAAFRANWGDLLAPPQQDYTATRSAMQ